MGVRGLQSFLKLNTCLADQKDINKTTLVIDANNILCLLFTSTCLLNQSRTDIYGGDLTSYAEAIRAFFKSLDECDITPILVFDGSVIGKKSTSDQLPLKEKTVYKRGLERMHVVKSTLETSPDDRILLAPSINIVFRTIVTDLGIQKIQTPYEADMHIARLCRDLDCPALTNDSDFLIFALPKGFILLDSFDYKNPIVGKDGSKAIKCHVYSQAKLTKSFHGLSYDTMPLLSVLLGNDYIESGTFDQVLNCICPSYLSHGPLSTNTWVHKRIVGLLNWLKTKTLHEAIDIILSYLRPNVRENVGRTIRILLRSYEIQKTDDFEAELQLRYPAPNTETSESLNPSSNVLPRPDVNPSKYIDPEMLPPAYLRRLYESKTLNSMSLDIVFQNTHYNYAIVDDWKLKSSSYVKYRPFSLAVTLLRSNSYRNMTTMSRKIQSEKDAFFVYDRVGSEYIKLKISPMEHLDGFGSLEHLDCYTMITLDPPLKKNLLMATFRFNNEEFNLMTESLAHVFTKGFLYEATLCSLLVKYISLETEMNPKPQFVDALMLTLFYHAALNGQLNQITLKAEDYGKLLQNLRPHAIKNNKLSYDPSEDLFRRIVHFINQFHSAYIGYSTLNALLNYVFPDPRYEKYFNSTLIFRLAKLLRLGLMKVSTLCQDLPALLDAMQTIRTMTNCDQ